MMVFDREKETEKKTEAEGKRRRLSPLLWLSSLGAIGVLVLGINGTLSQFIATIENSQNHVQTGGPESFGFEESVVGPDGQETVCETAQAGDAAVCEDINKNGDFGEAATPMLPGQFRTTEVVLRNIAVPNGLNGQLQLTPEAC